MKTKLLITILGLMPAMVFAQNYQTQYLTGTYFDQAYQYNITSGESQQNLDPRLQENQMGLGKQGSRGQLATTQDKIAPNAPPQNFNEPTPRTGR